MVLFQSDSSELEPSSFDSDMVDSESDLALSVFACSAVTFSSTVTATPL